MITVKSRTSGQPLIATLVKTSKLRRLIGLPYMQLEVLGANLQGVKFRMGWYRDEDIFNYGGEND